MSAEAPRFREDGFVVLRGVFDPGPLGRELDRALSGVRDPDGISRFRFAPMMSRSTPESLALLWRFAPIAADYLGGDVLPVRAKGVRYVGDTAWHTDSELPLDSLGFLAYLEPLSDRGALTVRPGSHRGTADGERVLATVPGDVIVMHERLLHASQGGGARRQWRVDFVLDGADAELETYYAGIFPNDWDGGYAPARSYDQDWRRSDHPAVRRLDALGVYALADRHERG